MKYIWTAGEIFFWKIFKKKDFIYWYFYYYILQRKTVLHSSTRDNDDQDWACSVGHKVLERQRRKGPCSITKKHEGKSIQPWWNYYQKVEIYFWFKTFPTNLIVILLCLITIIWKSNWLQIQTKNKFTLSTTGFFCSYYTTTVKLKYTFSLFFIILIIII